MVAHYLYIQGVCTYGQDGDAQDISQVMQCENDTIIQHVYSNANCSDEPFKRNTDIPGYCGGDDCEEYALVLTYLNESCSNTDGYLILPMLINDCHQYSFGDDVGGSYKFICDDETKISLGIFESTDCSDAKYQSYTLYEDKQCFDGEYAEVVSCPKDNAIKLTFQFTLFIALHIISIVI